MREFILNFEAFEPLVITDGSAESMSHQSLDYIPGNMLLGAMAGRWLAGQSLAGGRPDDHPKFRDLFLNGQVEWGHAYPMLDAELCVPIPKSFRRLKNQPGLPTAGRDYDDGLIINALGHDPVGGAEELKARALKIYGQDRVKLEKCPGGFMSPQAPHCRPDQSGQWNMHVSLDRQKRRAAEGLLFGFSSLAAGAKFQSTVYGRARAAEDLRRLLDSVDRLKVGHARSAGYGGLRLTAKNERPRLAPEAVRPGDGRLVIFLLSDYLSAKSWQSPLENLLEELGPYFGELEIVGESPGERLHLFTGHRLIAGFNNLWRLPRSSREALEKGGVIEARVITPVVDPKPLPPSLGGGRLEGYGRLMIDPDFLRAGLINISRRSRSQGGGAGEEKPRSLAPKSERLLKLMRRKALSREVKRLALEALDEPKFRHFIEKAAKTRVSQSQRGQLRRLVVEEARENWRGLFEAGLAKKTIKDKWDQGVANHPGSGRLEHLSKIMPYFLDQDFGGELLAAGRLALPGGGLQAEERPAALDRLHRVFLLTLLSRWEKLFRSPGQGGSE
ncbi:MAG: hypothetical protein LBP33_07615 [Candidatus Adiutrix sp.]|jgi:CRISPR-associated protein Csx10|nr:hypothetical protein [Candidatus Adiutrix sp.]